MRIYSCKKRFFSSALERFVPVGARVCKFENVTKLVLTEAPTSQLDPLVTTIDDVEYTDPAQVTWFGVVEPSPVGSNEEFFDFVETLAEDSCGNVMPGGAAGLHGETHTDGTDNIDGDQLEIDFTPAFFNPTLTGGRATTSSSPTTRRRRAL